MKRKREPITGAHLALYFAIPFTVIFGAMALGVMGLDFLPRLVLALVAGVAVAVVGLMLIRRRERKSDRPNGF